MIIEWLGKESGLWFGMMTEGVVAVSFSGCALHCVHNLREILRICIHYPERGMLVQPCIALATSVPMGSFRPRKSRPLSSSFSWSDFFHCYCMI